MADQVEIRLPLTVFNERTGFIATVVFKTRASAANSVPTTVEYKLYNISNREKIRDWTTLTPAASIDFAISAIDNVIQQRYRVNERMELLVSADRGLSTEVVATAEYRINNVAGRESR